MQATASKFGFNVTDVGLGYALYDVGTAGAAALGLSTASGTVFNVYTILSAADHQAVLLGGIQNLGSGINDVFNGINEKWDI